MNLADYTKSYFQKNKMTLEKNYPGINLQRLKEELYNLYRPISLNRDELFTSQYISSNNQEVKAFFLALGKGVPLEYITGKKFFYESEFKVSPDVLIPRSETEILVEKSIEFLQVWHKKTDEKLRICDVGTGSGCIVLSVMRGVDFPVIAKAIDLSEKALCVAEQNYFNLRFSIHPKSNCEFFCDDRLKSNKDQFHLIMSNPPYIKEVADKELVHQQVYQFEPHQALFLEDNDYQVWFHDFFNQIYSSLYEDGIFIMEGHEHHLEDLKILAKRMNWNEVSLLKDYCDRDRFLILKK